MKIYVDLAPTVLLTRNECGDCGSPETSMEKVFSSFSGFSATDTLLQRQIMRQAEPLYIQKLNDMYWQVCCTSGSGRMALLDQEALDLLDRFKTPQRLSDVIQISPSWSPFTLQEVIAHFYQLGFLHVNGYIPVPDRDAQPQKLTAWLHMTNACNLRCSYCYIQKTQENMQADTASKAVDAVFRSARRQHISAVHLKYAGGEASLHMGGVVALHDYAVQQAQRYGITLSANLLTNGVSLSERAIEKLQARGIGVLISLDGIGVVHDLQRTFASGQGSFKYVHRTITRLLAMGLVPSISVTVSRRSLSGLPELMHYLLELQLPFSLNYYREHASVLPGQQLSFKDQQMISAMRAAFQVIEESLPSYSLFNSLLDKATAGPHSYTCGVGRNYLVIDQQGGVAKCQAQIRQRVTTIEHPDPLQALREDATGVQNLSVDEKEGCRSCDWRYWCTGGCPLLTYQVTGRNDIRSPNCNIYKALFPDVLRLEALRLLAYQTPLVYEKVMADTCCVTNL